MRVNSGNLHEGLRKIIRMFRESELLREAVKKIHKLAPLALRKIDGDKIKIMHVCGTHEHTITYYGLRSLMPENLELIAGPGCPVCIAPTKVIDESIELALNYEVTLLTYGDMYKVPGTSMSLAEARSLGGDIRIVYGFLDALRIAKRNPKRTHVFLAVGFETTQPTVASHIVLGTVPSNLKILVAYRLTVPAVHYVLNQPDIPLNGIIAPGHVTAITGAKAWKFLPEEYELPAVVAGFEPLDVILAVLEILRQIVEGKPRIFNEYSRVDSWEGNIIAQKYVKEAFDVVDAHWRGIGVLPKSGLELKDSYRNFDVHSEYDVKVPKSIDLPPGCRCGDVTLGKAVPTDCPFFMKTCTPNTPYGPCMVSSEGTCAVWAKFGGGGKIKELAKILGLKP